MNNMKGQIPINTLKRAALMAIKDMFSKTFKQKQKTQKVES